MAVHVIIPVFNRLPMTQRVLACLRAQQLDEPLSIIIVDDGSTDGTAEYLARQTDVTVVQGTGSLWWGGAVHVGLNHVFKLAPPTDWVALVNNDTHFDAGFMQALVDVARAFAPAAVGSVIRDEEPPHRLLSIGAAIDPWRFLISDRLNRDARVDTASAPVEVDALSGRGALFPVAALRAAGGMRPSSLPHYLADYEVSLRVRHAGCKLLVNPGAAVLSADEYGSSYRASGLYDRLTSVRSPSYLPALIQFWWQASSWLQRLTAPARLLAFALVPSLRREGS